MAESRFGSRPIAFVGIAGSGKSAVACQLAARLGGPCVSLDARLAEAAGCSIAELFAREGEAAFRAHEADALSRAVADSPAVIDCGGGVVLDPRNRALLKERCRTVWLEVSPAEAVGRMGSELASRPLLAGEAPRVLLDRQIEVRGPLYEEVATWRIATGGRDVEAVVGEILQRLEESA